MVQVSVPWIGGATWWCPLHIAIFFSLFKTVYRVANRTWIPWFPLIVLGFFVLAESLKKGVLDTIFLNLSWFFFLCWIFPYILFTCISNFKFCAWFKHNAYAVAHKLLNQCKQNNILWYSSLNATIQGGQQSEVVHSGKVRWGGKGCFKVIESPEASGNFKKSEGGLSEKVRER